MNFLVILGLVLSLVALLLGKVETFVQFSRGHYEDHFCEIILNLDQWFRCHLKIFFIYSFVGSLVQQRGTMYAI